MGSSENFCLRWNDFESNVSGSFRELRAESDFFDVSIACGNDGTQNGGKTLQAHKLILSASSPFFKTMLKNMAANNHSNTNNNNPMIYLRGVRYADLENIIDFIYQGEVNVAQDDLNSFLAVAEDLQIRGLTQSTGTGGKDPLSARRVGGTARKVGVTPSAAKRLKRDADGELVKNEPDLSTAVEDLDAAGNYEDDAGTFVTYADESGAANQANDDIIDTIEEHADPKAPVGDSATVTDLNDLVVGLMTYDSESKSLTCNLCGKKSPWRTTMLRHIEANHVETAGHVCDLCGQVCKTRHAFGMHKRRKHGVNMSNQPIPMNKQQQKVTDEQQVVDQQQAIVVTTTGQPPQQQQVVIHQQPEQVITSVVLPK